MITYESDEELDEGVVDIYPAQTKPAKRTGMPYPKRKPQTVPVVEVPQKAVLNRNKPTEEQWEAAFDDANREPSVDTEMVEGPAKRPRKIKEYKYNIWEDLSEQQLNITFRQLLQAAPGLKTPLKQAITAERPTIRFADANQVGTGYIAPKLGRRNIRQEMATFEANQYSELEQRTSAYVTCQIMNYPVNAIVDTGAGRSIIAKHVLDRLGWDIEEPVRTVLVIADGSRSTPLGEVREVPITFENETITIDMIVTASETYQIILRNNWLKKAKANINLEAEMMTFTSRGQ